MIAEIGFFLLWFAFFIAVAQASAIFWVKNSSVTAMLSVAQFWFMSISFVCLIAIFVLDDFSVSYVAAQSNSLLPMQYKVSAVWGGHEGSMFLWVLILAGWTFAVALKGRHLPEKMYQTVLSVLGLISAAFTLFVLLTSNPFARSTLFPPSDGGSLNPLLQDIGLIIHPPLLYMGYVGLAVAFAFAISALILKRFDSEWARWTRPWTNVAWAFLTVGILLGSWWAYYELGWGGWWFWDPVENASFMPWLIGTALMHSLAVTEKRGVFKSWTLLLAIFAFSFSLLGTFLVRSGVLTSVHSFAADPSRGMFILLMLFVVIGGALTLFATRAPALTTRIAFSFKSRESFLLFNNVLLVVAGFIVLTLTLIPLLYEAMDWGKISVGPDRFNLVFLPVMAVLFAMVGVGQRLRWKNHSQKGFLTRLLIVAAIAEVVAIVITLLMGWEWKVYLGMSLALWVVFSEFDDMLYKSKNKDSLIKGLLAFKQAYWAKVLGHIGLSITAIGIVLVSAYDHRSDISMSIGDTSELAGYTFKIKDYDTVRGPNYNADRAIVEIYKGEKLISVETPEKRLYFANSQSMTEAAINAGFTRDIYVAMGEPLNATRTNWAIRLQVKPYVRWIWLGGLVMAFAGILAAFDPRYRKKKAVKA